MEEALDGDGVGVPRQNLEELVAWPRLLIGAEVDSDLQVQPWLDQPENLDVALPGIADSRRRDEGLGHNCDPQAVRDVLDHFGNLSYLEPGPPADVGRCEGDIDPLPQRHARSKLHEFFVGQFCEANLLPSAELVLGGHYDDEGVLDQ